MGKVIIVSSNCTTGSTAAVLQEIFPDDTIIPVPLTANDREMVDNVSRADYWITDGPNERINKIRIEAPKAQLIKIPRLLFSAFHPDLVYAAKLSDNSLIHPHYTSAIAVWCFRNGIDVKDAVKLFSKEVFAELGYFYRWKFSVELLKRSFEDSCLEFNKFFYSIQRSGVFMYSINHPKISVIIMLAKLIAFHLVKDEAILYKDICVNDALVDSDIWPVYPEIGFELSLPSAYEWRLGGRKISGLASYIDFVFEEYASQGISRSDIHIHAHPAYPLDLELCNRVLGPKTGVRL
jgi:hypothetical protein